MGHDETRKYIHDLANSISIVDASLNRVLTLLSRSNPQLKDEIDRLKKADEYVKKTITTIRDLREHVHNQIREESNQ